MTHEQFEDPAHSSAINADITRLPGHNQQHATVETTPTMSCYGLLEDYMFSEHRTSGEWIVQDGTSSEEEIQESPVFDTAMTFRDPSRDSVDDTYQNDRPTKRARIQFYDFAAQARLQQYHEQRRQHLQTRKRILQRSIALSARLRRTSSWVRDGLVEISKRQDPHAFAQVFSHTQDLVDNCFSYWNNELSNLDTALQSTNSPDGHASSSESFFEQLPPAARRDLLLLLSNLRSNPDFLISRLRALPSSQVATLTSSPKWQFSDAGLTSNSRDRQGFESMRKRQLQTYSRDLEDYATSLERSNPLSFLLHNIYSHSINPDASESQLRLYTWSTVCASLLETKADSHTTLSGQVLEAFASMQDWPAKTRIEIFLMDVLQRGAFLINDNTRQRAASGNPPQRTAQAEDFFNEAVRELYATLMDCGSGCFPSGALALARAILGKLSSVDDQSDFRLYFLNKWYLGHFLKTAIMYPENENMLLKMHVSGRARNDILAPIYNMFVDKSELLSEEPTNQFDEQICGILWHMVNMLDDLPAENPYATSIPLSPDDVFDTESHPERRTLAICAPEIVKVLEILSPQTLHTFPYSSIDVLKGVAEAWEVEKSLPKTRFDMLKQQLLQLMEPGMTAKDIHPCLELWAEFAINKHGRPEPLQTSERPQRLFDDALNWDLNFAQKAAFRLCSGVSSQSEDGEAVHISHWTQKSSLRELFEEEVSRSQAETRMVDNIYWKRALETLDQINRRPRSLESTADDTNTLLHPFRLLSVSREQSMAICHNLENVMGSYENTYKTLKQQVKNLMSGLEELRLKLWYTSQVIHSAIYTDARNVALALCHMNIPVPRMTARLTENYREQIRPSTSGSSRSSIFGEPQRDAMQLLKAPTEHGGPRKLADEQIESINKWLAQHSIDNFCVGEERLHRFCMEVQLVTTKLTGDTLSQSPDLWSSELFVRERVSYDVHSVSVSSAPASTRPSSIYSESASYSLPRPILRSLDSDVRSVSSDERNSMKRGSVYNLFRGSGFNTQLWPPELANSISSYGGRASSATTTNSDIFSLPVQSVTSASVYSRTSSILYGSAPNFGSRPPSALREKKKFTEQLRKGLVCLLLSDLGPMVWSWGCETDKTIGDAQISTTVQLQLSKRMTVDALLHPEKGQPPRTERRHSANESSAKMLSLSMADKGVIADDVQATYSQALTDILSRMGKQVDPVAKLQACVEFHAVAVQQMQMELAQTRSTKPSTPGRRPSLEVTASHELSIQPEQRPDEHTIMAHTEAQIIDHLKRQLIELKPTRLFRDLQFIAVFAPPEKLDKKAAGNAFMHLGMAALEYKKELCSSMVDVADKIMASDVAKEQSSPHATSLLRTAANYWRVAALERNRVAQRELAMLYLVHPEILSVVTLPLTPASTVFRDDIIWQRSTQSTESRRTLCLALHWMRQAARSGDEVAIEKLAEWGASL